MKRLVATVLAAVVLSASCGETLTDIEPFGANVEWRLSGTCTRSFDLLFIVDGRTVGQAVLVPGQTSPLFAVSVGLHTLEARENITNGVVFNFPVQVDIQSFEVFTRVLDC